MDSFEKKLEKRKSKFKSKSKKQDSVNKRVNLTISLSNKNREKKLTNKRKLLQDYNLLHPEKIQEYQKLPLPKASDFPQIANLLEGNNLVSIRKYLYLLRSLIALPDPPYSKFVSSGIVDCVINFLQNSKDVVILFESAWIICNIASTSSIFVTRLYKMNIIPILIDLLDHDNIRILEQVIWALGNISGDRILYRDLIIKTEGCIEKIIKAFQKETSDSELIKTICWAYTNFTGDALPHLTKLLYHEEISIISDVCNSLCNLTTRNFKMVDLLIDCNVIKKIIDLISHNNSNIQFYSLRCIGNVLTGTKEQTQAVIDNGGIICISKLLDDPNVTLRKESCWALSNICAGSVQQIQSVIESKALTQSIEILKNETFTVQKEAIWIFINICICGKREQKEAIIKYGIIDIFCEMLTMNNIKITLNCLQCLDDILLLGKEIQIEQGFMNQNEMASYIRGISGQKKITQLENSNNKKVSLLATKIMDTYFQNFIISKNDMYEIEDLDEKKVFAWESFLFTNIEDNDYEIDYD
ncbi:importin subunit alpha [Anaeramoeba flamelloides]|uniref:Importin subunit alpha n=1 Tax=Anaeramoeba flamelloides TaxID=1746091 RepID=A0ABQ8Y7P6_9EUKA|nr:importin subunit alpha [Anaeramoeba flamelloides]